MSVARKNHIYATRDVVSLEAKVKIEGNVKYWGFVLLALLEIEGYTNNLTQI